MATSYCDGIISRNIEDTTCANAPKKGIERVALIINRSDIDFANLTFDDAKKNCITAMALVSKAQAYRVIQKGPQPFSGLKQSAEVGTYATTVTNEVPIVLLNNDQKNGETIDALLRGEFVVVVPFKDKGEEGGSGYRVFGIHNGMTASAFEADPYGDTFGGGIVTLKEEGAPSAAIYLGTDATTGKALFDSLTAAAAA